MAKVTAFIFWKTDSGSLWYWSGWNERNLAVIWEGSASLWTKISHPEDGGSAFLRNFGKFI